MHSRRLGHSASEISEIGFGARGIGGKQWAGVTDDDSLRALKKAFRQGINFVDTALSYGDGHSERLVGKAIAEAFSKIFVATKIPPKNGVAPVAPNTPISEVYPLDWIVECTNQSLRNLGVEQIHLQQFEVWTDDWAGNDEWKRATEALRASGKVRFMGICVTDHEPDSALKAVESGMITAVQVLYNIFDQSAESNLFPLCEKMKVGIVARAPLDHGALTGDITPETVFPENDLRAHYFRGDRKNELAKRLDALEHDLEYVSGRDLGNSLPEIAIQFCLSHKAVSCVLAGMDQVSAVESCSRASGAGRLHPALLAMLKRHQWQRNLYQ